MNNIYGGPLSEERNRPDPRYMRADGELLTARFALQTLGSEWGRACYPDVWTALGVRRALAYLDREPGGLAVITDCWFLNEARAVRAAGGEVWSVQRPGQWMTGAAAGHISETEMQSPEMWAFVNVTVRNGGTLDGLRETVARYRAEWESRR